jgi:hypothetical protein
MLDTAVWRRFDARINIPLPDEETRGRLLDKYVKPLSLQPSERKFLLWATASMSGADVEALIAAGKRFMVLNGASDEKHTRDTGTRSRKLLEALQHQALLNARLFSPDRQIALLGNAEDMSAILLNSGFTQKEAGDLLGKSQSAISRTQKARPATALDGD